MANLDHVAPELISEVDKVLKDELANIGTVEQAQLGGVQTVAEMLNVMDKNAEKAIMSRVEEKDPLLAEEIRKLMFILKILLKLMIAEFKRSLRKWQRQTDVGIEDSESGIKDKFFKNLSKRAAGLTDG